MVWNSVTKGTVGIQQLNNQVHSRQTVGSGYCSPCQYTCVTGQYTCVTGLSVVRTHKGTLYSGHEG